MKRYIAALATGVFVLSGAGVAMAASGTPEIDEANATIALKAAKTFVPTGCAGEDGVSYVTYRGSWLGGETDGTPGSTDYNLTGALSVKNIVWTINLQTQRGVLKGKADLVGTPAAGGNAANVYVGPLTLVTQGLPTAGTDATVTARGWLNAATYTNGKADGGSILANVEFRIAGGFSATGEFGASMGFPDYSVATNNKVC
ncbi:MAG: hypothetical protein ACLQK4_08755 [Acidimicrobiales bacterium]|jgi:hypothetical protein